MSPDSRSSSRSPVYRKRKSSSPSIEKRNKKPYYGSASKSKLRDTRSRSKSMDRKRQSEKSLKYDKNKGSPPKSKSRDSERDRDRNRHQVSFRDIDSSHNSSGSGKHRDKSEKSRSNRGDKWIQNSRNSSAKDNQDVNGQFDRWPHDKFSENDLPRSSGQEYYNYRDRHRRLQEDDFMDQRRQERERIGLIGVTQVWGKSPPRCEDSDEIDSTMGELLRKRDGETDMIEPKKKKKKLKSNKKKKKSSHKKKKDKKAKKKKKKKVSSSSSSSSSEAEETELWVEKSKADNSGSEDEDGMVGPVQKQHVTLHRRMEAVRIRKENQIYSADEKRALAMFSKEERQKRENRILSQFKEMVSSKLASEKDGV
ncbi:hypothetical protein C0J52_05436 [Blattella germanica]|nr:hypothetical protein C0J52_05436 [Blattella germanica]